MKHRIILGGLLACLLLGQRLCGQNDTLAKNKTNSRELGFNVYTLLLRGGDYYSGYKTLIDNYAASGLYFKKYCGKNVLRFAVDYQQKIMGNGQRWSSSNIQPLSYKTLQLAAGYQRLLGHRRVVPYVAADVALAWTKGRYSAWPNDPVFWYMDYAGGYHLYTRQLYTLSVLPSLGLRLQLAKNIVMNVETGAQLFYMYEQAVPFTYRSIGINAKPLQCTLGLMF